MHDTAAPIPQTRRITVSTSAIGNSRGTVRETVRVASAATLPRPAEPPNAPPDVSAPGRRRGARAWDRGD